MKGNKTIIIVCVAVVVLLCVLGGVAALNNASKNNENEQNNVQSGENIEGLNSGESQVGNVIINESGDKVNVSANINKEKIDVDEFSLTDISVKYKDGLTIFYANVLNNSDVDYPEGIEMELSFFNESNNLISTIEVSTSTLNAHSSSAINARTTVDCSNASDISIKIK